MNMAPWLHDAVAYCLQLGVLAMAGAAAIALLRIRAPRPGLRVWQMLLIAALVLPLANPRPRLARTVLAQEHEAFPVSATNPVVAVDPSVVEPLDLPLVVALGLAAGVLLRVSWLGLGLVRLSLLRRRSFPYEARGEAVAGLQARVGTAADIRLSTEVDSPVTLGARHAVILLPARFSSLPDPVQDAALCHELLHVRRHDWVQTICEEALCAVLWFHPAVRFLVARIRLMREALVDDETIRLTGSRRAYVEALIAFADAPSRRVLGATPFLRPHSLHRRLALLSGEVHMSRRHLLAAVAALVVVVSVATVSASALFPRSPSQVDEIASPPARPEQPGPLRVGGNIRAPTKIKHVSPVYPPEALAAGIAGVVILETTLDEEGKVVDIVVLRAPEMLAQAAVDAVTQWEFMPTLLNGQRVPVIIIVTVNFTTDEGTSGFKQIHHVAPEYPTSAPSDKPAPRVRVAYDIDALGAVTNLRVLEGEEPFASAALTAVQQWRYEPPANPPVRFITAINFSDAKRTLPREAGTGTGRGTETGTGTGQGGGPSPAGSQRTSPGFGVVPPSLQVEDPTNRKFTGELMSVDFIDAPVRDVLRSLALNHGLNVVIDPAVTGTVTMTMTAVPWDSVMDFTMRSAGLTWTGEGNVIHIMPRRNLLK